MAVSNNPHDMFAAPIPGASLTKTPGSSPWNSSPPQFTDMHKALSYTWNVVLKDPDAVMQILTFLKGGVAITELVNTFLFAGVAGSKWSLDLALLMYQTFAHQIETIAKMHKVEYTFKRVNPTTAKFIIDYKTYLKEPETEPVKAEAKSLFGGLNKAGA
jgi:hypothetical protein